MPELPDVEVYVEVLARRIVDETLENVRIRGPFLLRSALPPIEETFGKTVREVRRLGKRICVGLDDDLWLVLHLMIAGRLQWKLARGKLPGRIGLAAFDFSSGTLILTEAGTQRRASLHVERGDHGLARHDRGGLEPLTATFEDFRERLGRRNGTIKRALTDPMLFSGIGNAYSDEILHRAGLSPFARTGTLDEDRARALFEATVATLTEWIERTRAEVGDGFPKKVTAFRPEMAVHGKYGDTCPVCETKVQRIVYAENETNYCPRCQTEGRILADRSLSRLLKDDWPRNIDELE